MVTPQKFLRVATRFVFPVFGLLASLKAEDLSTRLPRNVLDDHGYLRFHSQLPNSQLPLELKFIPGKLSLVADPQSASNTSIAAYIINGSGEPVPAIDFELTRVWQEVRLGESWKRTEELGWACGTVAPPKDLAPGHFLIERVPSPFIGRHEGEIRYCLEIAGGRPIVSQTIQGKFSLKGIDEGGSNVSSFEEILLRDLEFGLTRNVWLQCELAKSPEEFLHALELVRSYSTCELLRNRVRGWLAQPSSAENFRAEALKILNRPWPDFTREKSLFETCVLSLANGRSVPNPSSDQLALISWRILSSNIPRGRSEFANPERYDLLQQYAASGNPWGADQKHVEQLVSLALLEVEGDLKFAPFASRLLTSDWLTEENLPDDRVARLFGLKPAIAKQTALLIQARRDRKNAILQLGATFKDLPDHFGMVWSRLADRRRPFENWELPLAMHLLQTEPLSAYSVLSSRYNRHTSAVLSLSLPIELRPLFREHLLEEAENPKILGSKFSEYDREGRHIRSDPETYKPHALYEGLDLLSRWDDPQDTDLIRKFLRHPGASYSRQSKDTETKFYTVRQRACKILKERGEPIPADILLKEDIPARYPNEE